MLPGVSELRFFEMMPVGDLRIIILVLCLVVPGSDIRCKWLIPYHGIANSLTVILFPAEKQTNLDAYLQELKGCASGFREWPYEQLVIGCQVIVRLWSCILAFSAMCQQIRQ